MKSNRIVSLCSILICSLAFTSANIISAQDAADTGPALVESEKKSRFKEVMIAPNLSLKGYKNIVPVLSGIEYKKAQSGFTIGQTRFEVDEKTREVLKGVFGNIVVKELMKSKQFPLVPKPEEGSIYMTIALEDTIYYLPPPAVRRENTMKQILAATLKVTLFDVETGHKLMTIEDRRLIKSADGVRHNEWLPQIDEVERRFGSWAEGLRKEIEAYAAK